MRQTWTVLLLVVCAKMSLGSIAKIDGTYSGQGVPYGGKLFVCSFGSHHDVWAGFSMTGILRGFLDEMEVAGIWFEAGAGICHHGSFRMAFTGQNGTSPARLVGKLVCEDHLQVSMVINATRESDETPSDFQCGRVDETAIAAGNDLRGKWSDTMDLCIEKTNGRSGGLLALSMSWETLDPHFATKVKAFGEGYCHESGTVCIGTWFEKDASGYCWAWGVQLLSLIDNTSAFSFWWNTGAKIDPSQSLDPARHGYS